MRPCGPFPQLWIEQSNCEEIFILAASANNKLITNGSLLHPADTCGSFPRFRRKLISNAIDLSCFLPVGIVSLCTGEWGPKTDIENHLINLHLLLVVVCCLLYCCRVRGRGRVDVISHSSRAAVLLLSVWAWLIHSPPLLSGQPSARLGHI